MPSDIDTITLRFRAALDAADWPSLIALLDPACVYLFRGGQMTGVDEIVASYRTIDEWVRATFDSVRYESSHEVESGTAALISFRDLIDHGQHHLDHRCQQRIEINSEGLICTITHIDLEGEPEKAARFNAACGVEKPG